MFELKQLIEHSEKSFINSNNNMSKLNIDILNLEGMSGKKTRHLYNNICNLDNVNYLEIGTYKGSSFISSIFQNNINPLAIDNWSEFDGTKEEFINNVNKLCLNQTYNFLEKDCFLISENEIKKFIKTIDVYLYDGCHKYESHVNAITHYQNLFSKYFIIIVDDWRNDGNWERVQRGTYDGFSKSNLKIHKKIEIITHQESTGPDEYWNGFGLFVCENLNR